MERREVMGALLHYKVDEQILCEWWDRSGFQVYNEGDELEVPQSVWDSVLSRYQIPEAAAQIIYEDLQEALQDQFDIDG